MIWDKFTKEDRLLKTLTEAWLYIAKYCGPTWKNLASGWILDVLQDRIAEITGESSGEVSYRLCDILQQERDTPEATPDMTYEEWLTAYESHLASKSPDSYMEQSELLLVTQKPASSASEPSSDSPTDCEQSKELDPPSSPA